ncbi:DUF6562 domain-containing protein [Bacteroides sp. UBA939]|uniref:DUF6562 domain-containing protein n=1 Tax=Bacteroides sp. UBA939 TaxID=1946092 RepID=UPI0025C552EE|nr:DUF6562 domain-containing protein [Bacteroides sp. UBA939]
MKKILHLLYLLLFIAFIPLFSGCIHEYPDGEGIDPTLLTVEVNLLLNLEWKEHPNRMKTTVRSGESPRRRFIVEVWREGELVSRQTVIPEDLTEGQTKFLLPETLTLHALEYTVAVWTDHAEADSEDGLHHDATDLSNVTLHEPYTGNTDHRDCHYATTSLDLRSYRDQWNTHVRLDVNLERPLAKYHIIATDAAEFLETARKRFPGQTAFDIRFSYGFYFPLAFNVWEGKPANSQLGVAFTGSLTLPADGTEELLLGTDHIFVNGAGSHIPLSIEITTRSGELVGKLTSLNVPYKRGYVTTIRGRFLTAISGSGGIGIDPGFDGDIDIDLDEL